MSCDSDRVGRVDSDEAYVLGLCDEILGEPGSRQHRFDWLLGDPNPKGRRVRLPVDAFWVGHDIVVEYRERQHDQPVELFDKPHRMTISGVHRGQQRIRYDALRDRLIPANHLRLVVIRATDLASTPRGRLRRARETDLAAVRMLLASPT